MQIFRSVESAFFQSLAKTEIFFWFDNARTDLFKCSTEYVLQVRLLDKQWIQIFNKLSHNRHYRMHKAWHSMTGVDFQDWLPNNTSISACFVFSVTQVIASDPTPEAAIFAGRTIKGIHA